MGINSTEVAYGFGQLGSAHMHNDNGETLTPPDNMVIVAIQMLDDTVFDILTPDTANSVVYSSTESNDVYFGIGSTVVIVGRTSQRVEDGVPGDATLNVSGLLVTEYRGSVVEPFETSEESDLDWF